MLTAVFGRFTLLVFIFISGAVVGSGKSPLDHTASCTDITGASAGCRGIAPLRLRVCAVSAFVFV
jgi:hypothetical protein